MPKVSFLITVFNKAPYISDSIRSISNQIGHFEREFIFINDGSTDESWEIVKANITHLKNVTLVEQENSGPAIATNRAAATASGDYLKLVDADDVLAPYCTEALLDSIARTDSTFAFGQGDEHVGAPSFPPPVDPRIATFDDPLHACIAHGYAGSTHTLVARAAFEKAKGCDERIFAQDVPLFPRLAAQGGMCRLMHVVFSAPAVAPGRITENKAQILHDTTAALFWMLHDNPDLDDKYRSLATKKITGRSWKYACRHNKENIFCPEYRIFILSRLGFKISINRLYKALLCYRKSGRVRAPSQAGSASPA